MTDRIFAIGENGLETADTRVRSLTNNMVNAETAGFKKSDVTVKSFPLWLNEYQDKLYGKSGAGMIPKVDGSFYNQASGTLSKTGNSTDLAIGDEGYFVLSAPWGDAYTRDGRFRLDRNGQMVSVAVGYPLIGENGPIVVVPGSKIYVSETGEVKVDGISVGKVRIVKFDNESKLDPVSGALFRVNAGKEINISEVESPRIFQGYVEGSNVNIIDEMMELVYLTRAYNIDTKLIQTRDLALTRALEMGKPSQ